MENAQEIYDLIKTDNWEGVKMLLDAGLAVDALFSIDDECAPYTPLQAASGLGALRAIEGLISNGANVEHGKNYGTPLDCAVAFDKLEAAKLLLEKGANPNAQGPSEIEGDGRWTPLLRAVYRKNLDMVELLLKFGANACLTSRRGIGVVTCAAYNQDAELVQRFVTANAPVSGNSLLCAVERENENLVQVLLSAGCDPNYVAGKVELSNADPGETPLSLAIKRLSVCKGMRNLRMAMGGGRKARGVPSLDHHATFAVRGGPQQASSQPDSIISCSF